LHVSCFLKIVNFVIKNKNISTLSLHTLVKSVQCLGDVS
jgi:hypothetical protein